MDLMINMIHTLFAMSLNYPVRLHRDQGEYVGSSRDIHYALSALIGTHIHGEGQPNTSIPLIRHPIKPAWLGDRHYRIERREDSTRVVLGQAILMAFLTSQCVGAVIKSIRRARHGQDSLLLADALIFWLSLSGSFILGQSWCSLILNETWILVNGNAHPTISALSTSG